MPATAIASAAAGPAWPSAGAPAASQLQPAPVFVLSAAVVIDVLVVALMVGDWTWRFGGGG